MCGRTVPGQIEGQGGVKSQEGNYKEIKSETLIALVRWDSARWEEPMSDVDWGASKWEPPGGGGGGGGQRGGHPHDGHRWEMQRLIER